VQACAAPARRLRRQGRGLRARARSALCRALPAGRRAGRRRVGGPRPLARSPATFAVAGPIEHSASHERLSGRPPSAPTRPPAAWRGFSGPWPPVARSRRRRRGVRASPSRPASGAAARRQGAPPALGPRSRHARPRRAARSQDARRATARTQAQEPTSPPPARPSARWAGAEATGSRRRRGMPERPPAARAAAEASRAAAAGPAAGRGAGRAGRRSRSGRRRRERRGGRAAAGWRSRRSHRPRRPPPPRRPRCRAPRSSPRAGAASPRSRRPWRS
jgi:hypothetical protein